MNRILTIIKYIVMEQESIISSLARVFLIATIISLFYKPGLSEYFIIPTLVLFDIELAESNCSNVAFFIVTLITALNIFVAII